MLLKQLISSMAVGTPIYGSANMIAVTTRTVIFFKKRKNIVYKQNAFIYLKYCDSILSSELAEMLTGEKNVVQQLMKFS